MIELRTGPDAPSDVLEEVKRLAARFPGAETLRIRSERLGLSLTLGCDWRFDACPALLAALGEFGAVALLP